MLGTVEGTASDDIIGTSYTGDPEGEVVDGTDAPDGSSDDTIAGNAGNDTILAGEGNDTAFGGEGNDTIDGGSEDDRLWGDAGDDSITGGDGQDFLRGNAGNDTLDGGAGEDTLKGGEGDDVLTGRGAGNDWLAGEDGRDTISGNGGDYVDGGAGGDDSDTLDLRGLPPYRIENMVPDLNGNGFNGTVVFLDASGTPTGETMAFVEIETFLEDSDPNAAPDARDDTASTPEDTSVVIPVLANDIDPDGDTLTVTSATATNGTVTVNPDGTLTYVPATDFVGTDTITYTVTDPDGLTDTATVTVTVGTPVDNLAPDAVDDTLTVTAGTTATLVVLANDTDPEDDLLTVTTATAANGTVTINADGSLSYTPNAGFTGTDTITYTIVDGETGLDGVPNTDTATVTITVGTDPVTGPDGTVEGTAGADLIDTAYLGDPEGDRIDNNDALLPGEVGNDDLVYAFAGDDTVMAGDGDDEVYGGSGNDQIYGGDGNDSLIGNRGDDTLSGGAGDDRFRDGVGDNSITGGSGNDTIHLGSGNDSVLGGSGTELIYGGAGNDVIDGSAGGIGDFDNPYPPLPADAFPLDDRDTVYGGLGDDTIRTGDDADTIFGGQGNDTIDAGIDDDVVTAGRGDDTVIGGEGNDTISGNAGNDVIYGGLAPTFPDSLNIPDAAGDLVPDNGQDVIYAGAGDDTVYGLDDDDTIYGGGGNDTLDGGVDDDVIEGNIGNDTITGGQGNDTLSGGNDRDVFLGGNGGDVVDGGAGGDDFDVLNLTGTPVDFITYTSADREDGVVTFLDGSTLTFTEIENVVPCFTPGTAIATPRGERLVEELREGDRIITRDNGIQEIRWVGRKEMSGKALVTAPHLRPVLIKAGALGNGLPERDMLVSPNHRILVANDRTQLYFEESEVLAAAKHLVGMEGVHQVDALQVSYIHFLFDRHEVVLSNGAWTESFQPGDYSLKGIGNAQRTEIFELFPELKTREGIEGYQSARKSLKRHEARLLVK